jgi:transposase
LRRALEHRLHAAILGQRACRGIHQAVAVTNLIPFDHTISTLRGRERDVFRDADRLRERVVTCGRGLLAILTRLAASVTARRERLAANLEVLLELELVLRATRRGHILHRRVLILAPLIGRICRGHILIEKDHAPVFPRRRGLAATSGGPCK